MGNHGEFLQSFPVSQLVLQVTFLQSDCHLPYCDVEGGTSEYRVLIFRSIREFAKIEDMNLIISRKLGNTEFNFRNVNTNKMPSL